MKTDRGRKIMRSIEIQTKTLEVYVSDKIGGGVRSLQAGRMIPASKHFET